MLKITTDLVMTVSLLLLMTFEMIGEAAHEWIGTGMVDMTAMDATGRRGGW